jgi:hypothetical protein
MFPKPLFSHRIEEYNISINEFNSIMNNTKKVRFTITQDNEILMRFIVTDNTIFAITIIPRRNKKEVSKEYLLPVLNYFKNIRGYRIHDEVFLQINYFPIHFKFQNFLIANYENCDFITCDDQTFINLKKALIEKEGMSDNRQQRLNFVEPELNELKIYRNQLYFLINNNYFNFIENLYEFYSKKIQFDSHFKNAIRSLIPIKFEYVELLLKFKPDIFKEFNKEDARNLIKSIGKHKDNKDIKKFVMNKVPDYNFLLLRWVCNKGDAESLDIYCEYYGYISFYEENAINNFDLALSELEANKNISEPQLYAARLNSLKSLIFTSK